MPASFGYFQRKAIHDIANICGLDNWRLLNGSTAAAVGYPDYKSFIDSPEKGLLVVDVGGGTMTVSVMVVEAGIVDVKATVSHGHFGGEDIDIALLRDLQQVKEYLWCCPRRGFAEDTTRLRNGDVRFSCSGER